MPADRTVIDHLLHGRDALMAEVTRLTAAIEELDSVLGRIGSMDRTASAAGPDAADTPAATPVDEPATEPVNPPAEVEAPPAVQVPSRPRTAARKTPAKKSAPRTAARARRPSGEAPKSIRVHVLEMLSAENRDFGLAEIIDRVHAAGIAAHDDAVRSITIKLMKDGRVERVGRGQYRLARRGGAARASAATATAPRVTESAPEPFVEPAPFVEPEAYVEPEAFVEPAPGRPDPASDAFPSVVTETVPEPAAETEPSVSSEVAEEQPQVDEAPEPSADPGYQPPAPSQPWGEPSGTYEDEAPAAEPEQSDYTPPLNLGQPWR